MTPTEALEILRNLGACEPALEWLARRISIKPKHTLLDIWKELLKLEYIPNPEEPDWRPPVGTHLGHGWLAWVCSQAKVPCRNGTFSGMDKVKDGPHITGVDPKIVIAALEQKRNGAIV